MRNLLQLLPFVMLFWLMQVQAEQLLAVAPNVERNQQALFQAGYRIVHSTITEEAGLDSRLEFLPIAEVRALLARREAQMQIGGVCDVKRHAPVIYSVPFATTYRHLISADQTPVLTQLKDIRLLRLGLIRGYFYQLPDQRGLDALGVEVHYSKDLKTSVQLLLAGRVDAILSNAQVVTNITRAMQQDARIHFQMDEPFSQRNLCYVFPDTADSQVLAERMNAAISRLYHSGRLQQILVPPYQVPNSEHFRSKLEQPE
ncbi:MAG: hypothetical protein AseanaTS_11070 [Candidatus Pelagadaptatus aseana]|uniref:substrate-binding periplasmic protein n=1 Tax=Candidatus Pelagadaptatus aseana TaxID=3120508 RepID=UPI0039B16286